MEQHKYREQLSHTTMNKLRLLILSTVAALPLFGFSAAAQNPVYLSSLKPVDSHACQKAAEMPYSSESKTSGVLMLGGVAYKTGFALRTTYGPTRTGYVEYSLKGKYATLTFILGGSPYWATGNAAAVPKGILSVRADGRKILDKAVAQHAVPERITLDISGVDLLRFELVTDDVDMGIAEPALWTSTQTPRETGRLSLATDKPTPLVSDLRPYHIDNYHKCVSSRDGDLGEVKISGKSYKSGIVMNTDMRIIGAGQARTLFNLGGGYKTLRFIAGPVDSDSGTIGTAWLTVKADGKIIYEYEITENSLAKEISLDISGCRQLSIESEQADKSSSIAVADLMVYPEGKEPAAKAVATETLAVNEDLKKLPDICALVSNIPPYAVGGGGADRSKTVFDGKSDYITFSMGGVKFKEGVILSSSTNVLNDNTGAHAWFNLGGEFDYVSFTVGWLSKCGVLKNDVLRVYADDAVVLEVPLIATSQNKEYTVPLHKCQRLGFVKEGITSLSHPVFAIADLVVYRGQPVENEIFTHPEPDLPEETDLIDIGKPYIHYIFPMREHMDEVLRDGSTRKQYFELDGQRIYEGFLLQTSVHFDLEAGPLGGAGGGTGAVAGAIGSSVMVGAVGGATISVVSPFGALIALAAGGTGMESSCAAFNTYGAYDELTFTVARYLQSISGPMQRERLLIGGDGEVLQEIEISADMNPTTFTVPIGRCRQLMFWIQCGDNTSAQYLFYDLKLRKSGSPVEVVAGSAADIGRQAGILAPVEPYVLPVVGFERRKIDWEMPKLSGSNAIDQYFADCKDTKYHLDNMFGANRTKNGILMENLLGSTLWEITDGLGFAGGYKTVAKYVSCSDGQTYRSFELHSDSGESLDFLKLIERNRAIIRVAKQIKTGKITDLKIAKVGASAGLMELGFGAFSYGKLISQAGEMVNAYREQLDALIKEKEDEIALIESLINASLDIGGAKSDSARIFVK